MLFNADHANKIRFTLPQPTDRGPWELLFDTARPDIRGRRVGRKYYNLEPVSVVVFRSKLPTEEQVD
jgi:hypothetical protein